MSFLSELKCDACGHGLGIPAHIGFYLSLDSGQAGHYRMVQEYGKDTFSICYCCLLKAFGVKKCSP